MPQPDDTPAVDQPRQTGGPDGDAGRPLRRWRSGAWVDCGAPDVPAPDMPAPAPDEAAIAIVIDGSAHAVLMATPQDLDDFALGFALTEGLIHDLSDVESVEIAPVCAPAPAPGQSAWEARLWLRPGLSASLTARKRSMAGPVGCGLCGVDSIAAALPPVATVTSDRRWSPAVIGQAMAALSAGQRLWRQTPSIHAAAFWTPGATLVREDVGRHNALDKLGGAMSRANIPPNQGIVAISSRLSVDLVQKTVRLGVPLLAGAGVPTRLAIAWADAAGLTLVGRARGDAFEVYTHPRRLEP